MLIDFRQLFPKYNLSFSGVLHVGANTGEEAPVYAELGIKNVTWVEANPSLLPTLRANAAMFGHNVLQCCAGDEEKEMMLHIANNGGQSSSVLELGTHLIAHPEVHYVRDVKVQVKRLDSFVWDFGGNGFLNIDVQGFELNVLRGLGDYIKQFKAVYLEVNKEELYKGCALIDSVDLFMTANGLRRMETKWCGNTGWGDALYTR